MSKGSCEDTSRPVEWSQTRDGGHSKYAGVSQSEGVDTTSGQAGARPTALAEAKYGRADWRVLHVSKPISNNVGQHYILQINKSGGGLIISAVWKDGLGGW